MSHAVRLPKELFRWLDILDATLAIKPNCQRSSKPSTAPGKKGGGFLLRSPEGCCPQGTAAGSKLLGPAAIHRHLKQTPLRCERFAKIERPFFNSLSQSPFGCLRRSQIYRSRRLLSKGVGKNFSAFPIRRQSRRIRRRIRHKIPKLDPPYIRFELYNGMSRWQWGRDKKSSNPSAI